MFRRWRRSTELTRHIRLAWYPFGRWRSLLWPRPLLHLTEHHPRLHLISSASHCCHLLRHCTLPNLSRGLPRSRAGPQARGWCPSKILPRSGQCQWRSRSCAPCVRCHSMIRPSSGTTTLSIPGSGPTPVRSALIGPDKWATSISTSGTSILPVWLI